jgi:phosphate acetyltransferase
VSFSQDDTGETAVADLEVKFNELLANRKGRAPLPTAVVHPCSEDALAGAVDAAKAGLIDPILVGPEQQIRDVAARAKLDLAPYRVVATADAEESAAVAASLAGNGKAGALMKGSLHTDQYMHAVLFAEATAKDPSLLHPKAGE